MVKRASGKGKTPAMSGKRLRKEPKGAEEVRETQFTPEESQIKEVSAISALRNSLRRTGHLGGAARRARLREAAKAHDQPLERARKSGRASKGPQNRHEDEATGKGMEDAQEGQEGMEEQEDDEGLMDEEGKLSLVVLHWNILYFVWGKKSIHILIHILPSP